MHVLVAQRTHQGAPQACGRCRFGQAGECNGLRPYMNVFKEDNSAEYLQCSPRRAAIRCAVHRGGHCPENACHATCHK